ncbi:EAL domain-containing protein [Vibrio sp. JC009]|uniref:EAL domain-containing protein n=1 Tax=Vibrio sp. JC009 TaxID=2912314 RepID=UPI0023AED561|nr:EAL domain-containing protein [Vibrio sp. JC009]WED20665.1 EAL domain-containing protein [Vibrio sp. JC009]
MYIFGLILYLGIPAFVYFFPAANALVSQCLTLSPEITVLITLTYFYPLSVFAYNFIRKYKDASHLAHFRSQVTLASSLAVSFGLIGTFIGLSEMIAGIAAGMGADGDFSEKMEALLSSIGTALDSMSFAFLTSILGVSASVSILLASNYLNGFFEKEHVQGADDESGPGAGNSIDGISEEQQQVINENFRKVQQSIDDTINLINSKDKVWTDLFTLLENNSGSTVVQAFSDSLAENNRLAVQQSEQVNQIYTEQTNMYQKMETSLNDYSHYMQQQTHSMVNAITNMASEIDRMGYLIEQSSNRTNENIIQNGQVFERVNSAFTEALSNTNVQLQGVAEILHDIRVATALPLEESLNVAIRENAFHLVFQPQFNEDQTVIGAESYIRWIEPVRGLIPNGKLFDIAKKEGVSVQLELWVMRNTIQQVSQWQQQGMWDQDWTVSINATSELLLAANFITEVEKTVKQYDVMPGSIAFEVTEDVLMQHNEQAKDKIRQLHNMGMKLFIDNFGTGYTNIGHLSEFNPDRLKIARTIVNNLTDATQSGVAVVRSVMSLAQQLNITVSADGVETEEQFELLKGEGLNLFQGWYFEKPLEVDAFEQKLNSSTLLEDASAEGAQQIEDAEIVEKPEE